MSFLSVENLSVSYGDMIAVHEVSFTVEENAVFVLLGANGAGKTSVLRAISGLVPIARGRVTGMGATLSGLKPHQVARAGVAHVPEGRHIFPTMSVEDNLIVSFIRRPAWTRLDGALDAVYQLFPRLTERRRQIAGTLSGGEQQMLAIGRAMMNAPRLLMLDEPSLGLSPLLTELVFDRLAEIRRQGMTILLVEQNATCIEIATHGVVLGNGRVMLAGDQSMLQDSDFVRRAYLGM